MKKQTKKHKLSFYRRKPFLWTVGIIGGVAIFLLVAFRVSPWPGALVIRAVFNQGDVKTLQALEKHTPEVPITEISNQQYRQADDDANLDVYFPQSIVNSTTHLPLIVWTHGGAWVSGNKENVEPYYKLLAAQGFTVISAGYSLAPEHTYPTAVFQLNDMYAYIQKNADRFHVDVAKIILAGDSAGSQLSSQMAALITNPDYAQEVGITPNLQPSQLRGIVLNCGIYRMHDLAHPDPTLPRLIGWGTDVSVWAYSGTRDFSAPIIRQMSAYYHTTKDFPPTYITGGNADPLTQVQSMPFAEKLASHHVEVTKLFYPANHQPALPHEYQFNLDNDDGKNAFQKTVEFAKAKTAQ
jgi:acetyl esterase/lipase